VTLRALIASAALLLAPAAAPAAGPPPAPRAPWATINACDPPERPARVGVRVGGPNRRDAAQWVRIRIEWFDGPRRAWRVARSGADPFIKLSEGGGPVSGGVTYSFTPPASGSRLKLRGVVDVEWRRGRRVLSRARLRTVGGRASATDPLLAVSQATCVIRR
jgi:hypothetical protein